MYNDQIGQIFGNYGLFRRSLLSSITQFVYQRYLLYKVRVVRLVEIFYGMLVATNRRQIEKFDVVHIVKVKEQRDTTETSH